MSKRRKIGDRVWVQRGAAKGTWATIIDWPSNDRYELFSCCLDCGDDDCCEWSDLESDRGPMFYHVSECEMFDKQQELT